MTVGTLLLIIGIIALFVYCYWFAPIGWRTRIFSWAGMAVTAIWSGLEIIMPALQGVTFDNVLPAVWAGVATILVQVGNAMLREVTTTPPGTSPTTSPDAAK